MKTKVVYLLVAGALLCSSASLFAQDNNGKQDKNQRPSKEEMQKKRTQRLVNDLMLDDATAVKFTSLYEEYTKEMQACMPERNKMKKEGFESKDETKAQNKEAKAEPKKELTDAEIEKNMKSRFANERKRIDIQENYYEKFSKILSQKQVMKVLMAQRGNQNRNMRPEARNNERRGDFNRKGNFRNNAPQKGNRDQKQFQGEKKNDDNKSNS